MHGVIALFTKDALRGESLKHFRAFIDNSRMGV
jgi:hypothetical protein